MLDKTHAFKGEYDFLSNMYSCPVKVGTLIYPSSENAYQASKFQGIDVRHYFTLLSAQDSKKKAADPKCLFPRRNDWNDDIKIREMKLAVFSKFSQNSDIREKLIATGDMELIEYNWWHDKFWGVCKGEGQNNLGKILMEVRRFFI